ncbi:MAG: exopolyphosphatase [Gammaproteobacteria bacterium]|nr:exopolyphosphatase [Gammaproteobacteria bacterium]
MSGMIAAIDLGSNSFHMIVARESDGQLQVRDRLREMVRLAAGLDSRGHLDGAARQRALECLRRFGQRLAGFSPGSVRAVGTNTLRKARDPLFLREAEQALGHPIEIIAGVEEARLIYLGVAHGLPDSDENRLVVDIGGGSTELILGKRFEPLELESCYMGCVSYSQRFFADGTISEKAMRSAVIAARLELQTLEDEYRQSGWGQAVGASGTVKAVGEVVRAMGWCEEGITLEAMRRLAEELVNIGQIDSLNKLSGLKQERLPVFAGGVAVLLAIFESLSIEQMQVSDWALREGLLYDLLGRIRHEDVRERTIVALSERYRVDPAQAARVEDSARDALQQVAGAWALQGEETEHLLLWAARLHEIGLAIAHNSYHKHGAYLVANSDMPGFSSSEQRLLAILIRGHRRKFPCSLFKEMDSEQKRRLQRLCILLRMAVLLHRSHTASGSPAVVFNAEGKRLRLTFPEGWLNDHPLTEADLAQEAEYLQGAKYSLEFS